MEITNTEGSPKQVLAQEWGNRARKLIINIE